MNHAVRRTSSAAARKSTWLAEFQDAVTTLDPVLARKVEWDHAIHLFNSGYTPREAADRYTAAHNV